LFYNFNFEFFHDIKYYVIVFVIVKTLFLTVRLMNVIWSQLYTYFLWPLLCLQFWDVSQIFGKICAPPMQKWYVNNIDVWLQAYCDVVYLPNVLLLLCLLE